MQIYIALIIRESKAKIYTPGQYHDSGIPISWTLIFSNLLVTGTKRWFLLHNQTLFKLSNFTPDFSNYLIFQTNFCFPWSFEKSVFHGNYSWFSPVRDQNLKSLLIYKQPRQESGLCCFSFARYLQNCVTKIYRDLYGDAMFVSFWDTNMVAIR